MLHSHGPTVPMKLIGKKLVQENRSLMSCKHLFWLGKMHIKLQSSPLCSREECKKAAVREVWFGIPVTSFTEILLRDLFLLQFLSCGAVSCGKSTYLSYSNNSLGDEWLHLAVDKHLKQQETKTTIINIYASHGLTLRSSSFLSNPWWESLEVRDWPLTDVVLI